MLPTTRYVDAAVIDYCLAYPTRGFTMCQASLTTTSELLAEEQRPSEYNPDVRSLVKDRTSYQHDWRPKRQLIESHIKPISEMQTVVRRRHEIVVAKEKLIRGAQLQRGKGRYTSVEKN